VRSYLGSVPSTRSQAASVRAEKLEQSSRIQINVENERGNEKTYDWSDFPHNVAI